MTLHALISTGHPFAFGTRSEVEAHLAQLEPAIRQGCRVVRLRVEEVEPGFGGLRPCPGCFALTDDPGRCLHGGAEPPDVFCVEQEVAR